MKTDENKDQKQTKKMQRRITFEIAPEVEKGSYMNQVVMGHSAKEFIIDFGLLTPPGNKIKIVSRIITNPIDAKILAKVLTENIAIFEKKFGKINIPNISQEIPDKHHLH